jgi:enoyl-CoA hydratase/carnithine racemase
MSTPELQFETSSNVAIVTFNRPAAKNALTWAMYEALGNACEQVDRTADIRVLVLRSAGDAFVAGTDINQFLEFSSGSDGVAYEHRLDSMVDRLERVRVPTIAQVQGIAAGAGCVIALACDLRVCTARARFGMPIARTLGNCLSGANYARLVDQLGVARTKDLLLTGRFIDAVEAQTLGLVTRLADADAIDSAVLELAEMVAQHAPATIHTTKEALRRLAVQRRLRSDDLDDLIHDCYASDDFREGVTAFLERRKPRFVGR